MLFLDELPEFQPNVLDALRQPLETGETVIARANHRIAYPSRIQLVAAMNPCKCGGGAPGSCLQARAALRRRLSGAHLRPAARPHRPADRGAGRLRRRPRAAARRREGSAEVRARVVRGARAAARALRRARRQGRCAPTPNAPAALLEEIATPDGDGVALLRQAAEALHLSARGFHRTLRVARTLADLDGAESVGRVHIAEALSYRGETLRQASKAA